MREAERKDDWEEDTEMAAQQLATLLKNPDQAPVPENFGWCEFLSFSHTRR